jgi:predicted DNA-binding transcriptional regulator AlpA
MSKKITYDNLPEAISELIEIVEKITNLLESDKSTKRNVRKLQKDENETMNIQKTASFLNLSTATLYSYVKKTKIPFKKANGRLVFSKSELNKWKQDPIAAIDNNKTISVMEAHTLLNKPLASIYYIIKSRKLQVIEKRGKVLYYSKKDLIQALKSRNTKK